MCCGYTFTTAGQRLFPLVGRLAHMLSHTWSSYQQLRKPFGPCDPAGPYGESVWLSHSLESALTWWQWRPLIAKGERRPWPCLPRLERHKVDFRPLPLTAREVDSRILGRASGALVTAYITCVDQRPGPRPNDTTRRNGAGLVRVWHAVSPPEREPPSAASSWRSLTSHPLISRHTCASSTLLFLWTSLGCIVVRLLVCLLKPASQQPATKLLTVYY